MIAPIRETEVQRRHARSLAGARRAVANVFFRQDAAHSLPRAVRGPSVGVWLFVGWTVLIAATYFTANSWWTPPNE